MKKISYLILLIGILFVVKTAKSQSLIAVQNDSGTTFYSTLDLAITGATAGDYIYLPGGSFPISVSVNKQLQIIGVGHNPDSCAITGITQIIGNIKIINGSDRGSIYGVKISGTFSFGSAPYTDVSINYYTIERCNIGGVINLANKSTNILINESILHGSLSGNNSQGFQMSKCIYEPANIYTFDSNAYFHNNIFLYNSNYFSFSIVRGCSFRNNIFMFVSSLMDGYYANANGGLTTYSINNLFQNNIVKCSSPYFEYSTYNLFQNNISGPVSILFKNQSGTIFDYKQDYHILPASVAHNAGTDGTDLGIYGTGNPWKEGSLPDNPHIQSKSISTVNGALNVKVKAAAQDY